MNNGQGTGEQSIVSSNIDSSSSSSSSDGGRKGSKKSNKRGERNDLKENAGIEGKRWGVLW